MKQPELPLLVLRLALSSEVMLNGIAGGGTARGHTQLAVDGTDMCVNGAWTEHQLFGNLQCFDRCHGCPHP